MEFEEVPKVSLFLGLISVIWLLIVFMRLFDNTFHLIVGSALGLGGLYLSYDLWWKTLTGKKVDRHGERITELEFENNNRK